MLLIIIHIFADFLFGIISSHINSVDMPLNNYFTILNCKHRNQLISNRPLNKYESLTYFCAIKHGLNIIEIIALKCLLHIQHILVKSIK
jgi:hypothetical protein